MLKILRIVTIFCILLSIFTLSGCKIFDDDFSKIPLPPDSYKEIKEPSPKIAVDVYCDATVSMQGFTKLATGNVYRTLPDILGEIGGAMGETHFFRFGETITPIEGREYRLFINPDTYTETITSFGAVLDASNPEHISVVITDLFESDADWSNVTQKLREKYFSEHLAVAVIGVKNSFSGKIFDVGLNAASFDYDSGDAPERFRPFYIFLIGPESELRVFLEKWQAKQKEMPVDNEIKCIIFKEHFLSQPNALSLTEAIKNKNTSNIITDNRLDKADDRLQEASVANSREKTSVNLPINCKLDDNLCQINVQNLNNDIKIQSYVLESNGENSHWTKRENKGTENPTLDISQNQNGDDGKQYLKGNLNLSFTLDKALPTGKIGLLQVQVIPTSQSVQLPDWITEWDMGNVDNDYGLLDGAKTNNLTHIMASLKESLFAVANPIILEFDLVIDRR